MFLFVLLLLLLQGVFATPAPTLPTPQPTTNVNYYLYFSSTPWIPNNGIVNADAICRNEATWRFPSQSPSILQSGSILPGSSIQSSFITGHNVYSAETNALIASTASILRTTTLSQTVGSYLSAIPPGINTYWGSFTYPALANVTCNAWSSNLSSIVGLGGFTNVYTFNSPGYSPTIPCSYNNAMLLCAYTSTSVPTSMPSPAPTPPTTVAPSSASPSSTPSSSPSSSPFSSPTSPTVTLSPTPSSASLLSPSFTCLLLLLFACG